MRQKVVVSRTTYLIDPKANIHWLYRYVVTHTRIGSGRDLTAFLNRSIRVASKRVNATEYPSPNGVIVRLISRLLLGDKFI